ncbi:hypothetical protein NIES4074_24100 [Cylindrospermum sp. NIES-4074]|nr:hypothetical protein NIES4074_24100 [Cylindrospermum sp. NIES-4074]
MDTRYGTTEKDNGRRYHDLLSSDEQEGLGQSGLDSRNTRVGEQSRFTSDDSQWTTPGGTPVIIGDTSTGKILQRLDLIETAHLTYVRKHQDRLETRLDESKAHEAEFKQAVTELRQEIYDLASQASEATQ